MMEGSAMIKKGKWKKDIKQNNNNTARKSIEKHENCEIDMKGKKMHTHNYHNLLI